MTTLIAYDGSGSTGGKAFYHEEVQRIVARYPRDSQILFWDSSKRLITRTELADINRVRAGYGGTEPTRIAEHVASTGFAGDLVIITDGEVGSVDHIRVDNRFRSVTVYLIDTGGRMNLSVCCPFTRRSPHEIYRYNAPAYERVLVTSATAEEMAVITRLDTVNSVATFEAIAPALEKALVSATMGTTGDPALRDALLAMKARIQRSMAAEYGRSNTVGALTAALDARQLEEAIGFARTLTDEYYGVDGDDPDSLSWSGRISRFIAMTEGALRGTFDLSGISAAIRGDRARRAPAAAIAVAAAAPVTEAGTDAAATATATPFECPITFDTETDVVLLITEGEPLLAGVDKDTANSLYDCPLNLLNYPDLVNALVARIDHPISLRALKDSYDSGHPIDQSPMTRTPVAAGAICLGANEEHCRATTWSLANLFLGGRLLGNQDFWYACVWLLVERGRLAYLAPILPQLRAQMLWRLTNHTSSLSLTGVPEFPTTRVPLRSAVWYVVAASAEFGMDPRRDVLRTHLPHLEALQEILALTGLAPSPAVARHILRLRTMLSFLARVKRNRHELPNLVLALTQACVEVDVGSLRVGFEQTPRFIPIDGAPGAAQMERARTAIGGLVADLSVEEIVGIAALVDPSKSAGDIPLPIGWVPRPLPASVATGWPAYGLREIPASPTRLCPATCRPYYRVRVEEVDTTWSVAAERFYGATPARLLSVNEAYGNFVVKYKTYPTRDELLTYLYNRRVLHGGHATLPHQVAQFVDEVISEAAEVTSTLSAEEFARRYEASRKIEARRALE